VYRRTCHGLGVMNSRTTWLGLTSGWGDSLYIYDGIVLPGSATTLLTSTFGAGEWHAEGPAEVEVDTMIANTRTHAAALCLALLTVFAPASLGAQVGTVSGRVVDAITREPIPDVIVSIVGSGLSAGTDSDGRYTVDSVFAGLVRVNAQILGYIPITTDYYTVLPDSTEPVDFALAPVIYELEGVEVTGERPVRTWRAQQGAKVLTKEMIPKHGDILTAITGLVPGVRTKGTHEDTRMIVRNAAQHVLYVVDGQVIRPPLTFYIEAARVECVEVRRGFTAVSEFKPSIVGETYAGVVLIWTEGAIGPRPKQCLPHN
jgi:hypothetical protein